MFWFWVCLSMLGYSVQNVLMARYVRSIEVLSAGFYRSVSFFITFLPLLFWVPVEAYGRISEFWIELVGACVLGACSQWTRFLSVRYLPIGIASSGTMGFNVLLSWGLGYLYFSEILTLPILLCLLLILSGSMVLTLARSNMAHLDAEKAKLGALMVFITSIFISTAMVLVAKMSRELDPFLTAYLWEAGIAIAALILILGRYGFSGIKLERVSLKTFVLIALCVSPTLLGTMGFALAIQLGPLAITSAISATGVFVITGLSVWMYGEKLRPIHYAAMILTVLGVVLLRLQS